jgi:dienelactone hydrolase
VREAAAWGVLVAVFLGALVVLGRAAASGPPRVDLELAGGIPATLTLPASSATARGRLAEPLPHGERPPAVVLAHGFSGDRVGVASLARRLASAGYAVLTFDFRGHGENPRPFPGSGAPDALATDLAAAADFLRTSPWVDGARIAVAGHSMGAGAVLDFATRDSGVSPVVAISGGHILSGPYTPQNVLFVFAAADPARIRDNARVKVARLAGFEDPAEVELARTYGDAAKASAVRAVEIAGTDHGSILWSEAAAAEIVAWLDAGHRVTREAPPDLADPRLAPFVLALVLGLPLLAGAGRAAGSLAPPGAGAASPGALTGLGAVVSALLAALAVLAAGVPAAFLPLAVGDVMASLFGVAGLLLVGGLALRGDAAGALPALRGALGPALLGFAAVYVISLPLGVIGHRMAPTPARALVGLALAATMLPFWLGFERLLRRGGTVRATAVSVAGRVLLLATLALGVATGAVPGVVMLMLPTLAALFVMIELFAAAAWARSSNVALIALVESLWIAWVIAVVMPLRA